MKKIILVCLVVMGVFLGGCSYNKNSAPTKTITNSNEQNDKGSFIMGGKITTNEDTQITSNISARVSEVSVDIGTKVTDGQVVIKLDTQDLQNQVDQAQNALNAANSNLTSAQSSTYNSTSLTGSSASSNISTYQSQINQAQAVLKTAQNSLNNATITSPISGTVSAKNVNVGDMAYPGKPLISIVNSDKLYVNAYVPSYILNKITVGQNVIIRVPDLPDQDFQGKVTVINSKVESQSSDILVQVSINGKNPSLKPGMFAEIGLE